MPLCSNKKVNQLVSSSHLVIFAGLVCIISESIFSQLLKCLPADIIRSMQKSKCIGVVVLTAKPFVEHRNQGNSETLVIPTVLVSSEAESLLVNSTNSTLKFLPTTQDGNKKLR